MFRVGNNRDDDYHEVFSIYQAVSIRESVTVGPSAQLQISVSGSITPEQLEMVPRDHTNLVARAAGELALNYPSLSRSAEQISYEIEKRIPVLGGMAGGSADAAAALLALAGLWGLEIAEPELQEIGAKLGSDVPFALLGGTAIGQGRGEQLTRLDSSPYHWVLVFSPEGLSTPKVFRELDRLRGGTSGDWASDRTAITPTELREIQGSLTSADPKRLARWLENDLQTPAIQLLPQLGETLRQAQELGAVHVQLSGSGPTIFLLAEDESHSSWLVEQLTARQHRAVAVIGNAIGARLEQP